MIRIFSSSPENPKTTESYARCGKKALSAMNFQFCPKIDGILKKRYLLLLQNETIMKTITQTALAMVMLMAISVTSRAQNNFGFPVQVKIENGTIEGLYDPKTSLQTYFGVPFAKPPVGDLRWKAPQPLGNWSNVKETKAFGPRPVQGIVF